MSRSEGTPFAPELREYADALDADRGHDKSRVTQLMREAADEIERLEKMLNRVRNEAPNYIKTLVRDV